MTLEKLLKKELKNNVDEVIDVQSKASKPRHIVTIWFGVPGAGKSTFAAWVAKKDMKKGIKVWSNVPITGTLRLDPNDDIGNWMITNGRVIIDEAGIEYNNREFKSFNKKALTFFKYHRHNELAIDLFSQGFDDCDKKIRVLAQKLYVVKKTFLPWFVMRKEIRKKIGINEVTKEIIDEYYFVPFGFRFIFAPSVWNMFNTISRESLPEKEWPTW